MTELLNCQTAHNYNSISLAGQKFVIPYKTVVTVSVCIKYEQSKLYICQYQKCLCEIFLLWTYPPYGQFSIHIEIY